MNNYVCCKSPVKETKRAFRTPAEKSKFTEDYLRRFPNAEISYIIDNKTIVSSQVQKQQMIDWFGDLPYYLADRLTRKVFGIEALKISKVQLKSVWNKMDNPLLYRKKDFDYCLSKYG